MHRKSPFDRPQQKISDPAEMAARILNRARAFMKALHDSFVVPDDFLPKHPERQQMVEYLKERAWRGTDAGAASALRIPLSKLREWRKIPEFVDMEKLADEACTDLVEEQALFLAFTGDKDMMRRVLEARRPEKYAQRVEHSGPRGQAIPIQVVLGDIPRPKRVKPDGNSGDGD